MGVVCRYRGAARVRHREGDSLNAATVDEILALRDRGLSAGQIAYRLGLNESTVRNWWTPRSCSDCGAGISWGTSRCSVCAMQPKFWTREAVIEAMQSWARVHGRPPSARDWVRADRDRRWPASSTVYKDPTGPFSSWAEALEAAGFDRPKQGQRFGERWWTRDLVINEIRRIAADGLAIASRDESLASNARELFGDWHTACAAAGVQSLHVGERREDVCRPLPGEAAQAHKELGS